MLGRFVETTSGPGFGWRHNWALCGITSVHMFHSYEFGCIHTWLQTCWSSVVMNHARKQRNLHSHVATIFQKNLRMQGYLYVHGTRTKN